MGSAQMGFVDWGHQLCIVQTLFIKQHGMKVWVTRASASLWRSEVNFQGLVLFFFAHHKRPSQRCFPFKVFRVEETQTHRHI